VDKGGGNRALGEVHQDQLDMLADSDGDGLADTLQASLAAWIVDYNLPGAAVPYVRRQRPRDEKAEADTSKARSEAAETLDRALRAIVKAAASFDDDAIAREYIVSFGITDRLSDRTIDALVSARASLVAGPVAPPDAFVTADPAEFAANRLKKKR
jgi:hypothetical protein